MASPQLISDLVPAEEPPPESSRHPAVVVVRCGGAGALKPPPPSSRSGPRVPTLIGLGEDGDDFYSRKTLPNLRLPRWHLPREFEVFEVEQTPEPFLVTPRPPEAAAHYLDRERSRPITLLDGIDDAAARAYIAKAERLVERVQQNPETRPQGIVATLSAFVDALWQALSMPVANK